MSILESFMDFHAFCRQYDDDSYVGLKLYPSYRYREYQYKRGNGLWFDPAGRR
ncbi:MAG TPA: hypothetical protein VFC58_07905 [Desulfosporosinus sp.]|nr:hypothetical protein [Desulfosporosinus sp.]